MLTFERLGYAHANAVSDFINKQNGTITNGFFSPPTVRIITMALKKDKGLSLGAFDNNVLVGIRLTYFPGVTAHNHGHDLDYSQDELLQVAQFHGTLVKEDKRYNGIGHELVKKNCDEIFMAGYRIILATVHPENEASLKMVLKNGFAPKKLVTKYGGLPRIILEKRIS